MKKLLLAVVFAFAPLSSARAAGPGRDGELETIERSAHAEYVDGHYAFCSAPNRPLGARQRSLCPLAAEIEECKGLVDACNAESANEAKLRKDTEWMKWLLPWLGRLGTIALYLLVFAIIGAIAVPVVGALLRRRRRTDERRQPASAANRAIAVALEEEPTFDEPSDAEATLRSADEHRRRGEGKEALALYLAAALGALDRRGAIRVARHRTNGEYVRSCADPRDRLPLREIVREVDQVQFGGGRLEGDALGRVAAHASTIVRAATTTILLVLSCVGCSAASAKADPAGNELPIAILERNGYEVKPLETSLATMPIPVEGVSDDAPVVVVDIEKVTLEADARAHLVRWVDAGGVVVLFGRPESWPEELRGEHVTSETRTLAVGARDVDASDLEGAGDLPLPLVVDDALAARRDGFVWRAPCVSATLATIGGATYAASRAIGRGSVVGVANDDLFTNVGVMPRHNAAALVALFREVSGDVAPLPDAPASERTGHLRWARAEDGIPPPSNPFSALVAAGLGKGTWHALAAAVVLLLAYGVRHARPRRTVAATRRAFAEHVEATGTFYGRAHAHTHALAAYGGFVVARLREVLPRGVDPIDFLVARSGLDRERIAELYGRAETASALDEERGDELETIEALRRVCASALGDGAHRTSRTGRPR